MRQDEAYKNLLAKNEDITYTNLYNEAQEADWELEATKAASKDSVENAKKSAVKETIKKPEKGDRHYREYQNMLKQTDNQLQRSARSYARELNLHLDKTSNPALHDEDWHKRDDRAKNGLLNYWNKEIEGLQAKLSWAESILLERGQ